MPEQAVEDDYTEKVKQKVTSPFKPNPPLNKKPFLSGNKEEALTFA